MSRLVSIVAFALGLGLAAGPVLLSLFIAGVEPSRPVRLSWLAPSALVGLAASAGSFAVAFWPLRIAAAASEWRLLVGFLVVVPASLASYLLGASGVGTMVVCSVLVLSGTVLVVTASVWPAWLVRSNQALQRIAFGGR
jgi:hypothetical protein